MTKNYPFPQTLLLGAILLLIPAQFALAHGTVTYPPSRIWTCYQESPETPNSPACIAAVASHGTQPLYDWNEINQPNAAGQHTLFIPDGMLASGGRPEKYGGMDQVRSDWVATPVTPGPLTVTWTNSAPHATSYYEVYITKEGWTPDQALSWDQLELLVQTEPSYAASTVYIPVTLPTRTGKHILYSIWQRSDSPEAFYSTSDIDFGTTTSTGQLERPTEPFRLQQSYPNPSTQISRIGYQLEKGAVVSLKVYNIHGQEVATLVEEALPPGSYEATFDAADLSNGIYLYVLQADDYRATRRMVLQR
ncbi:MAG: lytic polysaccharide monooxygenase [Bacteroidota bacterium]